VAALAAGQCSPFNLPPEGSSVRAMVLAGLSAEFARCAVVIVSIAWRSRLVLDGLARLADHGAHGADAGFVQVDPALLGASTLTLG
jgi:hypothetical protein